MSEKQAAAAQEKKAPNRFPPELQAMSRIQKILKPFGQAAQLRILDWNRSDVQDLRPAGPTITPENEPDPNGDL